MVSMVDVAKENLRHRMALPSPELLQHSFEAVNNIDILPRIEAVKISCGRLTESLFRKHHLPRFFLQ